jgi:hypothetical protein
VTAARAGAAASALDTLTKSRRVTLVIVRSPNE